MEINKEKIGNAIIYLTKRINNVYLTKVIKLLYLIDESSVKETGVPFTWLPYSAWKMGPVPEDIYNEIKKNLIPYPEKSFLSKFITIENTQNPLNSETNSYIIKSKKEFENDEFTEYEIDLMDRIIEKYGNKSATELIDILHKADGLWHNANKPENSIKKIGELSFKIYTINFKDLIKDDEYKQLAYNSAKDSILFNQEINKIGTQK